MPPCLRGFWIFDRLNVGSVDGVVRKSVITVAGMPFRAKVRRPPKPKETNHEPSEIQWRLLRGDCFDSVTRLDDRPTSTKPGKEASQRNDGGMRKGLFGLSAGVRLVCQPLRSLGVRRKKGSPDDAHDLPRLCERVHCRRSDCFEGGPVFRIDLSVVRRCMRSMRERMREVRWRSAHENVC